MFRHHQQALLVEADPRAPIGMYAEQPIAPSPRVPLIQQLLTLLRGEPGIRLAGSTARNQRYFGTDIVGVKFPDVPRANGPRHLEVAPLEGIPSRASELIGTGTGR